MTGVRQILVKKKKGPMFTKKKINKLIYTLSMMLTVVKKIEVWSRDRVFWRRVI